MQLIFFALSRCTPLILWLLPLFYTLNALGEKNLVLHPLFVVNILFSPLSDIFVEHPHLCQKVDPFIKHHGVGDFLDSCLREFSTLFQLFNQLVKEFRGVVGPPSS